MYVYNTLELIILGDNVTMCANIPCGGSLSFFTSREFVFFFWWLAHLHFFLLSFFLNVSFNPTLFLLLEHSQPEPRE